MVARHAALKFVAVSLLAACALFADGGPVLLRQQSGPFLVTVFGAPQAAPTDLSVLVENARDRTPLLDADVVFHIAGDSVRATHDQASNKLLYAALVNFSQPGPSRLAITVTQRGSTATLSAAINVAPAPAPVLAYWPYFALVPAAILLFALNQWLKQKRRAQAKSAAARLRN